MPDNRPDAPSSSEKPPTEPSTESASAKSAESEGAGAYHTRDADETARMPTVEARRRITERFLNAGEAIEHTSVAVIVLRPDLQITAWNQCAGELLGMKAEEAEKLAAALAARA